MPITTGTVEDIEVVHREYTDAFKRKRYTRLIVWAKTSQGRVWIHTIEKGLDSLKIEIKVAMTKQFFKPLIGETIVFSPNEPHDNTLFAARGSLPPNLLVSYKEIRTQMGKWAKENFQEEFAQRTNKALATRKANAQIHEENRRDAAEALGLPPDSSWRKIRQEQEKQIEEQWRKWDEEEELQRKQQLEEQRKKMIEVSFQRGRNPKYGSEQWEASYKGKLLILAREYEYDLTEGKIFVRVTKKLVPNRIYLVRRVESL